jgi:hypothetical protein
VLDGRECLEPDSLLRRRRCPATAWWLSFLPLAMRRKGVEGTGADRAAHAIATKERSTMKLIRV